MCIECIRVRLRPRSTSPDGASPVVLQDCMQYSCGRWVLGALDDTECGIPGRGSVCRNSQSRLWSRRPIAGNPQKKKYTVAAANNANRIFSTRTQISSTAIANSNAPIKQFAIKISMPRASLSSSSPSSQRLQTYPNTTGLAKNTAA